MLAQSRTSTIGIITFGTPGSEPFRSFLINSPEVKSLVTIFGPKIIDG